MIKKLSALALAGMIALPVAASAGGGGKSPSDINNKIDELSRQLEALKAQLSQQNEVISEYGATVDGMEDMLDEKSEAWDLAARIKFYGDFRARMDYYSAQGPDYMNMMGQTVEGPEYSNDTMFTNRFRLNMRVKATENIEFKGRLAMYKAWGLESYARNDMNSWWPQFDGNTTRTPSDNALRVDRAFVNWNGIGGAPIWLSIGRRPTTDGPPAQIRLGADKRMATPVAYMDYPFDGLVR